MSDIKQLIAKRVAQELHDGDVVNLGIGLPTLVANYVSDDLNIYFQSENGLINLGPAPDEDNIECWWTTSNNKNWWSVF